MFARVIERLLAVASSPHVEPTLAEMDDVPRVANLRQNIT